MQHLPVENFDTMFTEHAAVSSNGLCTNRYYTPDRRIAVREIYYDSWAYQGLVDDTLFVEGDEIRGITTRYDAQLKFPEQEELIEVRSGFGGLAVYRMDSLKDCEYHPYEFCGKKAALCEHGGLNEDIRKNGGQVFINTKYQPVVQAV